MGGFGSGNHGGRPTADMSLKIDLAWMLRTGRAVPGKAVHSSLHWTYGGEPSGSISYSANMIDPEASELRLAYRRSSGGEQEEVKQIVRLIYSQPNFGGRRWWMVCPCSGARVAKLYLPNGGDRFAGRKAWRLNYQSQRHAHRDRPFEKLFRLQRRLGCTEGYDMYIRRPKGMWRRTFERHVRRYEELEHPCSVTMLSLERLLRKIG